MSPPEATPRSVTAAPPALEATIGNHEVTARRPSLPGFHTHSLPMILTMSTEQSVLLRPCHYGDRTATLPMAFAPWRFQDRRWFLASCRADLGCS